MQWPKDNTTRFRDGKPWPEAIAGANRDPKGRATGTEGGYTIINARRIWDADPNHQTISYSTDQNAADLVVLEHELKSFSIVFSMADIHRIIGPNAARYVGMADQIGTLEAGKLADIILIDGNPTLNIYEMLKTKVVDVLDADTGALITHIDVTAHGAVNSVAIHNGLAALAVEAASQSVACPSCDRRNPGKVLFYDTATRTAQRRRQRNRSRIAARHAHVHARRPHAARRQRGRRPTSRPIRPTRAGRSAGQRQHHRRRDAHRHRDTGRDRRPSTSGNNLRTPISTGMDFEPEYIAVNDQDTLAFVTVQEANALAVLDLRTYEFTDVIGLGAKDFNVAGNEIDPKDDDGVVSFRRVARQGLLHAGRHGHLQAQGQDVSGDGQRRRLPRGQCRSFSGQQRFGRRLAAGSLRVSNRDSSPGNLFADRRPVVLDSRRPTANWCTTAAASWTARPTRGCIYDDGRSRDKGVEPEGVALLKIGDRTYAFIGLERATNARWRSSTSPTPTMTTFVDMIVTTGDLSPMGQDQHLGSIEKGKFADFSPLTRDFESNQDDQHGGP